MENCLLLLGTHFIVFLTAWDWCSMLYQEGMGMTREQSRVERMTTSLQNTPMELRSLYEAKLDTYNEDDPQHHWRKYYGTKEDALKDNYYTNGVCDIVYEPESGNIGLVRVHENYRRQGLGTQMVKVALADMGDDVFVHVYTVEGHPFWKNIIGGSYGHGRQRNTYEKHISEFSVH